MVKKGGTKRKIPIKKISKKESLATAFSKRSYGLFSKASQICLLTGGQIAILATPPSSNSNVDFFSFGHTSVDAVVFAFLTGQRLPPVREETRKKEKEDLGFCLARKELGLELWWEDERLARSEDPENLTDAINSMSRVLKNFKELRNSLNDQSEYQEKNEMTKKKSDVVSQTLNLQPNYSPTCCQNDLPGNFDKITEEQDQIMAICDSFCATEKNNNNSFLTGSLDQEIDEIDQSQDFDLPFDTSCFDDWVLETTQETTNLISGFEDFEVQDNLSFI